MAQAKSKTKEVVVKVKKSSAVKVRTLQDARPFLSTPGVKPLNELSESQLIAEGYRAPLFIRPNFKKTEHERAELALSKFKKKDDTPWTPYRKTDGNARLFVMHVKNTAKENRNVFKTTYSAMLKDSEILGYLNSVSYTDLTITKITHGGKVISYGQATSL